MLDFLWLIFIAPIEFCMKAVFEGGYALTHSYGLALIGVSLVVNTAVLPIYNKAEGWQEEERALKKRMEPKEKMIRRCFRGQERFAMISTLYRQSGYSPLMTLRASIGILLQIPFFLAAYLLLSNMTALDGVSFGPIRNLGAPDGLLSIAGVHINVLPILMTAINLFSAFFYTHGLSRRDKIQLYGMAGIFLVLLYNSPAGLTFYWTLNNVYSLCKNIVQKDWMKRPGWEDAKQWLAGARERLGQGLASLWARALRLEAPVFVLLGIIGAAACAMLGYGLVKHAVPSLAMSCLLFAALAGLGILGRNRLPLARRLPAGEALAVLVSGLGLPYVLARYGLRDPSVLKLILGLLLVCGVMWALTLGKSVVKRGYAYVKPQKQDLGHLLFPAMTLLAFLVLVYLPFMVFQSDPFVFDMSVEDFASDRFGIFLVVMLCVAFACVLLRPVRWVFGLLCSMCALAALVFCFIAAPDVGVMDAFAFQNPSALDKWYNVIIDAIVLLLSLFFCFALIYFRRVKILGSIMYASLTLLLIMTGVHFTAAKTVMANIRQSQAERSHDFGIPEQVRDFFTFSKKGKNVVVVMLDMFSGGNMNQLLERHPQLKDELDGFIWYEDVVTGGWATLMGKPGILGGEAAHPLALNQNTEKSLEEKVCAAYGTFFRDLQEHNFRVSVYETSFFSPDLVKPHLLDTVKTNFVNTPWTIWDGALLLWAKKHNFNVKKVKSFHNFFTMNGLYNIVPLNFKKNIYSKGSWNNTISNLNWNTWVTATKLANLELPLYASNVSDTEENSFIYFVNELTHWPWILNENGMPDTDKSDWKEPKRDFKTKFGITEEHLRAEYFALKHLIEWFNWMKANGVYNNTQIILVSDHDYKGDSAEVVKAWGGQPPAYAHGLLLVKEYDAHGELRIDRKSLMVNWDVPTIIRNAWISDSSEKKQPWLDASRERKHVTGHWIRANHPKNEYTIWNVYSIQGPLYKKESFKKIQ
ncbi:MAG: hypothetical protein HDQ92_03010 [Desulfovibrio sp.]|nr:hypothetical protein [Desulfovibrio sp.]